MKKNYPNIDSTNKEFLDTCKLLGVFDSKVGEILVAQVDQYLGGETLNDIEFESAIDAWRTNQFCYGYFVNTNDTEFANYLKNKIACRIVK